MASNEIVTKFTAEVADFNKKVTQIQKELGETGKKSKEAGGGFKDFTSAVKANIGIIAAGAGTVIGIVVAINNMTKAYKEQEEADVKLQAAIRATGGDVEQLTAQYKAYASEIQAVTTYGDELVENLISQAKYMGIADDKVKDATEGAIGLAEAFGIDTNTALKGVANALEGNFSQLERYIPALRSASTEAEKQAILQKSMADGFQLAKDRGASATGQMTQLANAIGDTKEQFGEAIVTGIAPFVSKLLEIVTKGNEARQALKDLKEITEAGVSDQPIEKLASALIEAEDRYRALKVAAEDAAYAGFAVNQKQLTEARNLVSSIKIQIEKEEYLARARANYANAQSERDKKKAADDIAKAEASIEAAKLEEERIAKRAELEITSAQQVAEAQQAAIMATAEMENANIERQRKQREETLAEQQALADNLVDSYGFLAEAVGMSLVDSAKGWDYFKEQGKNAIIGILKGYSKTWLAESIAYFAKLDFVRGAGMASAAAGGLVAAGAIKGFQTGSGGAFTVPEGFQNDSFPIGVSSGEQVFVKNITQQMNSGNNMFHIVAKIGEKVIIDTVQEAYDNRKLILVEAV